MISNNKSVNLRDLIITTQEIIDSQIKQAVKEALEKDEKESREYIDKILKTAVLSTTTVTGYYNDEIVFKIKHPVPSFGYKALNHSNVCRIIAEELIRLLHKYC